MRVVSGTHRGRKLVPIKSSHIRPTADRVKEAVFNILGPAIRHTKVLDLFSGSGAMGIEALSRGADLALFVDINLEVTRSNISLCRFKDEARTCQADILSDIPRIDSQLLPFDFIFMDPPYLHNHIEATLSRTWFEKLIHRDTIIIAEHSVKESINLNKIQSSICLDIFRQKKYSQTMISMIQPKLKKEPDLP